MSLSSGQPDIHAGSTNQVRVGDVCQLQLARPRRSSSSLLLTLRRRASEPLTQRYVQRPGETHTRYTYRFNQSQEGGDKGRTTPNAPPRSKCRAVSVSQSLSRPKDGNLNRDRKQRLDSAHAPLADSQANARHAHRRKSRHARSRTLDDVHKDDDLYVENIRAMAGRMYGDPPTLAIRNAHLHKSARSRVTSRQHVRLSDGL